MSHCKVALSWLTMFAILAVMLGGCSSRYVASGARPRSADNVALSACRDYDDDRDGVDNCDDDCPATAPGTVTAPDGCPALVVAADETVPSFPTRPPRPAVFGEVDPLQMGLRRGTTLGQFDDNLCSSLRRAGYSAIGHYSYPGGFVLLTQLERIHSDGRPFPSPARWLPYAQPMTWGTFDLMRFLRMLVNADPGYYRVIAYVVSDRPISFDAGATSSQFNSIINKGATALPAALRSAIANDSQRLTVLVYEMTQAAVGKTATRTALGLSVDDHLTRTRILAARSAQRDIATFFPSYEEDGDEQDGPVGARTDARLAGVVDF